MSDTRNSFLYIAFLMLIAATVPALAQKPTGSANQAVRVNLYYHLGSVEIPEGFGGYVGADWNHAWGGSVDGPMESSKSVGEQE